MKAEEVDEAAAAVASIVQGYRAPFNETIAPPGGPLGRVVRPPIAFPPESKRAQTIEDAEEDLEQDMEHLKSAVHAYNEELQRRIDAVKASGRALEQRIHLENNAMEESIAILHEAFTKQFQSAFLALEKKTLTHFAKVESNDVAAQERKIRECEADAKKFYYTTVPEIMEKLQGAITRRLEKNHETFDIENAKIQKRERKTLSMLESNERKTEHLFALEQERRVLKFQEVNEEFHHVMRVDNREAERKQCDQINGLHDLQRQLQEERTVRENEDVAILDKVAASFHRLQTSIMENLGEASTASVANTSPPETAREQQDEFERDSGG
ncbi:TPA: hypothetical protein N0F65_000106 [Lagenidium giganteum]|uniref:Uncharacterized protein n=1 Tax=Lagenidium giganteum TaxID=4803 RepID=A0AAV2YTP8_9STRA|nr:TPA: hypothetical protein N0F65_000106 [Lagenidium giganteum]